MQRGGMSMIAAAATVVGGIALSTGVMWQASSAAFTASTNNAANSWNAGTVALNDDDSSSAMFTASGLRPGSTAQKCIKLTYNGSLSGTVKLYSSAVSGALGPYLDLQVEEGTGGDFSSCTGFTPAGGPTYTGTLANFGSTKTDFTSGVGTFAPTGAGQVRTYRITYTLNATTPDAQQGATASATFNWQAAS
ncbi:hypothetical protein EV385_5593 [Krasilnikovia cinnamomea]|uniref:Camelysin-like metallo-endopeptidase n=2 Tax=Krasilnikovia cinnamomea TaxID=349313 RepID=A0A4Q7ZS67_9ACTN|nr:hypothetical protein EV385_4653 [Krasilnikovia cinnamomea]RZU53661.1 hypothetical protein EV385_5593 [Krasilnikovia cinnamomea]